jgi:hypothetical protein
MKLMTKALEERFAEVGNQENVPFKEKVVIAKYFNPCGAGTWFATEYEPETRTFFGYASIFGDHNDEWGYFSLDELESLKVPPFGLGIERDLHFGEKKCGEVEIINCYD